MVFHNQQLQRLFQEEMISSRWFWETGDMHRPRALLRCTQGAAGAKKAAWTGANWKRIDFPPKFQLDLSSAHVYSTNPSFPPLALIGLQSFLLPLLALTAFLNEPQKFSSISCKGKFSLGNDQVWCGQKYHLLVPFSDLHFPRFSVAFMYPNDLHSCWFIFPLNEPFSDKMHFLDILQSDATLTRRMNAKNL